MLSRSSSFFSPLSRLSSRASSLNFATPALSGSLRTFHASQLRAASSSDSSVSPPLDPAYDAREKEIHVKLAKALEPSALRVQDISGGCGAQYAIEITSNKFNGLRTLQQHRMVNEILKEELKQWHAVRLTTKAA